MTLTAEQLESLRRGEPVRVSSPELGGDVVVIGEAAFREIQQKLDIDREAADWAALSKRGRDGWADENPY